MKMQRNESLDLPRVPQMRGLENRSALSGASLARSEKSATGRRVCLGVKLRIGTVNVGSMSRRDGEVVDMLERRNIDICCLQETRWKGSKAKVMGDYKFYWIGCKEGLAGVGVMVAERWVNKVKDVVG